MVAAIGLGSLMDMRRSESGTVEEEGGWLV